MANFDEPEHRAAVGVDPDKSGVHNLAKVAAWASRHVAVPNRDALRVMEALQSDGRGRLIVLRGNHQPVEFMSLWMERGVDEAAASGAAESDDVWGPIGCVLPLNENVDAAVVALVTGHVYVVWPDEDDEGTADPEFRRMVYPNRAPIYVTARDVQSAENAFMQYTLPHDGARLLSSDNPAQLEEVSGAIREALRVIVEVDFAALRTSSESAAASQLFGGLGNMLGVEGEPE